MEGLSQEIFARIHRLFDALASTCTPLLRRHVASLDGLLQGILRGAGGGDYSRIHRMHSKVHRTHVHAPNPDPNPNPNPNPNTNPNPHVHAPVAPPR